MKMKILLILRHGKAEEGAPSGRDRDRALTKRGERDAEAMGRHLRALVGRAPDAVVTSDARRARQTAVLAAAAVGFASAVTEEPAIYNADVDTLLECVRLLPEAADCVLLVGHNPGFEQLAALLAAPGSDVPELPTAGLAHLEFDIRRWTEVRPHTGRLRGVHTPKGLEQESP